jgi:coenzyme PQQ biosynthesis protein PqqD
MNLDTRPQRNDQILAQNVGSDFLLFNMNDGNYFSLNEVGRRIWELCDGTRTIAQIVDALAAEYDAPREQLSQDVLELLETLRNRKLVELSQTGQKLGRPEAS